MGVRAIDQKIFRLVLGKTKMFYCPRLTAEGNITLWFFLVPRVNILIYCLHSH